MKTLAQRRAAMALNHATSIQQGQGDGNVLSGFPMLVRVDGLLAALALAVEKKDDGSLKHKGEFSIAEAIVDHLREEKIVEASKPLDLARELAGGDAILLRRATAEALAFLSYLKRYAA